MEHSQKFLATIRLAIEGAEAATRKLKKIDKTTTDMAAKRIDFPWLRNLPQQSQIAQQSIVSFSKELKGFSLAGQKLNTVWKEGQPVGAR
ncbi:MAG: hypothetical protein ACTSQJ_18590, partial [Promethearchaeota archaeon]